MDLFQCVCLCQKSMWDIFLSIFQDKVSHWIWCSRIWLARNTQGPSVSASPALGVRAHATALAFHRGTRVWIQILMLVWQSSLPAEPSPCPPGLPLLLTYCLPNIHIFINQSQQSYCLPPGKALLTCTFSSQWKRRWAHQNVLEWHASLQILVSLCFSCHLFFPCVQATLTTLDY